MIDQIKFNICTIRTPPNASMQGIVISSVFSRYIIVAYMLSSRESTLDNFWSEGIWGLPSSILSTS
jgi:hypothetical protein